MGIFSGPPTPKPPKPVIAPPTPARPKPAQAARPRSATNASADSRISTPNQSQKIDRFTRIPNRKRSLLGGPSG